MSIVIDVDLRPQLTQVRDQGDRETCLAHSATAAHEQRRGDKLPLSAEYLHFFSSKGFPDGASFEDLAAALKHKGQPKEKDCPYQALPPAAHWKPPEDVRVFKRLSNELGRSSAEVERIIQTETAVILGISVPEPFFCPAKPWIIEPSGPLRGLHAVTAVGLGHDNAQRLILIRNSWGTNWGENGYAWLEPSFLDIHLKKLLTLTDET